MNTPTIISLVALISTMWGFFIGYKTSIIIAKQREAKWWAEMTYEDQISETPIYNKLMREYGNLYDMPRQ